MKKLILILFLLINSIGYSQQRDTIYLSQKIDTLQIIQNYLNSNQYLLIESYTTPIKKEKNRDIFIGAGIGLNNIQTKYTPSYFFNMNLVSGKWNIGANCSITSLGMYISRSIK